jgi:hypothetical protein
LRRFANRRSEARVTATSGNWRSGNEVDSAAFEAPEWTAADEEEADDASDGWPAVCICICCCCVPITSWCRSKASEASVDDDDDDDKENDCGLKCG